MKPVGPQLPRACPAVDTGPSSARRSPGGRDAGAGGAKFSPRGWLKWGAAVCRPRQPNRNRRARDGARPVRLMGRSQAVRQRILIPPFGGSIPPAPARLALRNQQVIRLRLFHSERQSPAYSEWMFPVRSPRRAPGASWSRPKLAARCAWHTPRNSPGCGVRTARRPDPPSVSSASSSSVIPPCRQASNVSSGGNPMSFPSRCTIFCIPEKL
jgi:hypothetical protein